LFVHLPEDGFDIGFNRLGRYRQAVEYHLEVIARALDGT